MSDEPPRHLCTTDDAVKLFTPGRQITLKPSEPDCPEVTFTILKLSTPVTKSTVVLAKPNEGDSDDQVVIKIFDPRYLDERISDIPSRASYPWDLTHEQSAATARAKDPTLSDDDLVDQIYADDPADLTGEDLATHHMLWEERFYRLMMDSHDVEREAYARLKDLQGSALPRLIMAGVFLPPDARAIRPPALVLEYIPSVTLHDVPCDAITPDICEKLVSVVASFPSYGVIHNDITLTNLHFTPPEKPVRGFVIDFGCAVIRGEDDDEEYWREHGASDAGWAKKLLEDKDLRKSYTNTVPVGRFG